jgi:hypothetical protein
MTQVLKIKRDDDASSPREYDNLGHMVCWHRRYKLGDEKPSEQPADWIEAYTAENPDAAILPLYLYDHGGISISCGAFSCPWDSGQLGWVVVDADRIRHEYSCTEITAEIRERVIEVLKSEVECYDAYLRGDVWGYVIEEATTCDHGDTHYDHVDSCWGFIGTEGTKEAIGEHLPPELQGEVLDKAWSDRS